VELAGGVLVHLRVEQLETALALSFGDVHRQVRVAEKVVVGMSPRRPHCDADTGVQLHLLVAHDERGAQGLLYSLGRDLGALVVDADLEEEGELVSAEAGSAVARTPAA
jgi:hypothetical protein